MYEECCTMYYISQVCVVEDIFCFVISSIYPDKVVLQSLRLIVVIVILFLFLYFHFLILLLPNNIIFYSYQYSLQHKMYCSYYVLLLQQQLLLLHLLPKVIDLLVITTSFYSLIEKIYTHAIGQAQSNCPIFFSSDQGNGRIPQQRTRKDLIIQEIR